MIGQAVLCRITVCNISFRLLILLYVFRKVRESEKRAEKPAFTTNKRPVRRFVRSEGSYTFEASIALIYLLLKHAAEIRNHSEHCLREVLRINTVFLKPYCTVRPLEKLQRRFDDGIFYRLEFRTFRQRSLRRHIIGVGSEYIAPLLIPQLIDFCYPFILSQEIYDPVYQSFRFFRQIAVDLFRFRVRQFTGKLNEKLRKTVSIYAVYYAIITGIEKIINAISAGSSASIGNLLVTERKEKINAVFDSYEFIQSSITTVLFSITTILIIPFMKVYMHGITDANYIQPVFAYILIFAEFLYGHRMKNGTMFSALKKYRKQISNYIATNLLKSVPLWYIIVIILGVVYPSAALQIEIISSQVNEYDE